MLTGDAAFAVELGAVVRARLTGFTGFLRANGFGVGGTDAVSRTRHGRKNGDS